MSRQVLCDQFRQEQFVPARQVRSMLSVYIASRGERSANQGLGCAVKDLYSGEEKKLKIAALTKMGVRFPNGKRVKAFSLRGGETYTMLGMPTQPNYGVFIVPKGTQYEYMFEDKLLPPGSCIVWDGKKSKVIGYKLFRKLFIMSPNPVSSGRMRGERRPQYGGVTQGFPAAQQPVPPRPQQQRPMVQQPQSQPQDIGYVQAHPQSQQNSVTQLIAIGRWFRNGKSMGLILTDGVRQVPISTEQCIIYADEGVLKNVKAVPRSGTTFLSGNGISLESLPVIQG